MNQFQLAVMEVDSPRARFQLIDGLLMDADFL
jgi:hypothetical protein